MNFHVETLKKNILMFDDDTKEELLKVICDSYFGPNTPFFLGAFSHNPNEYIDFMHCYNAPHSPHLFILKNQCVEKLDELIKAIPSTRKYGLLNQTGETGVGK